MGQVNSRESARHKEWVETGDEEARAGGEKVATAKKAPTCCRGPLRGGAQEGTGPRQAATGDSSAYKDDRRWGCITLPWVLWVSTSESPPLRLGSSGSWCTEPNRSILLLESYCSAKVPLGTRALAPKREQGQNIAQFCAQQHCLWTQWMDGLTVSEFAEKVTMVQAELGCMYNLWSRSQSRSLWLSFFDTRRHGMMLQQHLEVRVRGSNGPSTQWMRMPDRPIDRGEEQLRHDQPTKERS